MARTAETGSRLAPSYQLVRSRRKTMTLIVRPDSTLEVRCPYGMPQRQVDRFIREKAEWIAKKQDDSRRLIPIGPVAVEDQRRADRLIRTRIIELVGLLVLPAPRRITIRDLVSRWGSCSAGGAISINRRCAFLPEWLLDYVILHEFCHLQHLNHSHAFWQHLATYQPDAVERRRHLKRYYLVPDDNREEPRR